MLLTDRTRPEPWQLQELQACRESSLTAAHDQISRRTVHQKADEQSPPFLPPRGTVVRALSLCEDARPGQRAKLLSAKRAA